MITKEEALQAINNSSAKFISEEWIVKDCWELTYEYNGYKITIGAYSSDRWLADEVSTITPL